MRYVLPILTLLIHAVAALADQVVDQSHIVSNSTGGRTIYAGSSPAQTFTVGASGLLSQVDLLLLRDIGDIGSLSLELWPVVAGGPAGSTPIFSTPIDPAAVSTTSSSYVPINVTSGGLFVSPGDQFAIAVTGSASLTAANASWSTGFPGYSAGAKFSRSGAWELGGVDNDYGFRTWVDSALTPSGLQTLDLTPTSEWSASLSTSGGSAISTAGDTMRVSRAPSFDEDRRGLMEFDASGLPEGAKLRWASLTFDINQRSESGTTYPTVATYGYQADGSPSDADARGLSQLLGQSAPITTFDPVNIRLDVPKVASMIQNSPGVGIVAYGATPNLGVNIVSSQLASHASNYSPPTLTLGYSVPSFPARDRRPAITTATPMLLRPIM